MGLNKFNRDGLDLLMADRCQLLAIRWSLFVNGWWMMVVRCSDNF